MTEGLVIARDGERVRLRLAGAPGDTVEVRARVAVPGYAPTEGDRVLVTSDGAASYVIGVLVSPAMHRAPAERAIATAGGASAEVEGESLRIRDAAGRLVVAFDAATGALELSSRTDLRLAAPNGRVVVESGKDIDLDAGERIVSRAGESELSIDGAGVAARAPSVTLEARSMSISAGSYELAAGRLVERATDAFRTVEELFETRAKHARSICERTLELIGRRTTISSQEDTRVEGKRVLLG
jgi:hypothetical protein